ncbi:MAG: hypothetical protein WD877_00905 [Candidatus Saccharimonadales bacterium]
MDSLGEILGQKKFTPPDEFKAVREYIKRRYQSNCYVKIQGDVLIIAVSNSALAATLHLEQGQLIATCGIKKRLIIRTGTI